MDKKGLANSPKDELTLTQRNTGAHVMRPPVLIFNQSFCSLGLARLWHSGRLLLGLPLLLGLLLGLLPALLLLLALDLLRLALLCLLLL